MEHETVTNLMMPDAPTRATMMHQLFDALNGFFNDLNDLPVTPTLERDAIVERLQQYDFAASQPIEAALDDCLELLRHGLLHTTHPRYFGLFNPTPNFPGILADLITAVFNPQLAVWSHAPAAVEIERHVITFLGSLFGWSAEDVTGHFTTGGAEANYTAVLLALTTCQPDFAEHGARAFAGQPVLYTSSDSHLAWLKITHQVGLGRQAVRLVPTDGAGRMDVEALSKSITQDREDGAVPVMIVATAGTTGAGMIDPLRSIAKLAALEQMHLHVDAAWGGAVALSPRLASVLDGIDQADSITVDAHKWLAVPMGAGMFLCRDQKGLYDTFRVSTSYMPPGLETADPYTHSVQWSRRFIGLKLFLSLAVMGREGYAATIERQTTLGESLREKLMSSGWSVENETPLPVICFTDASRRVSVDAMVAHIVADGENWISETMFEGQPVMRACITSHWTREQDLDRLMTALDRCRSALIE